MNHSYQSSYPKLLSRLHGHWEEANRVLPPSQPLTLKRSQGQLIRVEDIPDLQTAIGSCLMLLQNAIEDAAEARLELDSAKRAILFRAHTAMPHLLRSEAGQSGNVACPSIRDNWPILIRSLEKISFTWMLLDQGSHRTLVLPGKYGHLHFAEEIEYLKDSGTHEAKISTIEGNLRRKYETLLLPVPSLLEKYSEELRVRFPAGCPVAAPLPEFPPRATSVLPPSASGGVWLPGKNAASIFWEPSGEKRPHFYEIRYCPGERYDPVMESTVGAVPAESPANFLTKRFGRKGMPCLFRVYTVLESLADAGDEPVTVIPDSADE